MSYYLWEMRPYFRQVAGQLVLGSIAGFIMNTAVVLPAILLGLGAGIVIGVVNAVVVVVMRIDSFIATLATGALIQALITMATKGTAIIRGRILLGDGRPARGRGFRRPCRPPRGGKRDRHATTAG